MTNPLFVSDLATLKEKLRLAELPTVSAANPILDEVILVSRLEFLRRLGEARVGVLIALPFTENPLTEDESVRALANTTEVKLVRCELLRRLPTAFMDASGEVNKSWNEEAPVRELGAMEVESEISRCQEEIEKDMQILSGQNDIGNECEVQAWDGSPTSPAPCIGDTVHKPTFRNNPLG